MQDPRPSTDGITTFTDRRFGDLLKSLQSQAQGYNPWDIVGSAYDSAKRLAAVTNSVASSVSPQNANKFAENQAKNQQKIADTQKDTENTSKNVNSQDADDAGLLAMIFNIVPIGINIAKKGDTIAAGLGEIPLGITEMIANLAMMTAIIGIETFTFICALCYYLFKLLMCTVAKLLEIPKCIVFYLIDLFIFALIMIIVSFLFIIDMVFMTKARVGISCVETFMMSLKLVGMLDEMIYQYISVHLFRYPEPVLELCYRCSLMGDTRAFWESAGRLFEDVFITLPDSVGEPLNDVVIGFGHLFSFFDI